MDGLVQSNFVFLNLEPICREVKAKMPSAHRALFSSSTNSLKRRQAFLGLLDAIESSWIGVAPEALKVPNRRRATLALYALINGSPMDACSDAEIERLLRQVLPSPIARNSRAAVEPSARYAAV